MASKDPKTKYTSNAATKYKDELKKRAAADAREYATFLDAPVPILREAQFPRRGCRHRYRRCDTDGRNLDPGRGPRRLLLVLG